MFFAKKGPKVVISGYYGFDNSGDEAILMAMVKCFKKLMPEARLVVLSNNPVKTREMYGVKAVSRWQPLAILFELIGCDLFISGGGSLLQDVTSARSLRYYMTLMGIARRIAVSKSFSWDEVNNAEASITTSACLPLSVQCRFCIISFRLGSNSSRHG